MLFMAACSEDEAPLLDNINNQQIADSVQAQAIPAMPLPNNLYASSTAEFVSIIRNFKVNLTNNDLQQISMLTRVNPTGEWTPGPENNPKANLTKHFIKHGPDFKPPVRKIEDYLSMALKASGSKSPDWKYYFDLGPYIEEKLISVDKWNPKTGEFCVTRLNGQIATYYYYKKLRPDRYILIPDEMR